MNTAVEGSTPRLDFGFVSSVLLGVGAFVAAVSRVWVADDAYITFRHINQFLAGNGLTFNTLERVEGFTHPLWAVLLCVFGWMGAPISGVAVTMDLICAAVLLALVCRNDRADGPLGMALLVSCSGFIDFSTSGLETPMTLLLVYYAYSARRVLERPITTGMSLGLAYLCHPDVAVLGLGVVAIACVELLSIGRAAGGRAFARFIGAFATAPLAWHAFRLYYYGDLLPNTYYAKNGGSYWSQGFAYIVDFATYAPLSAAGLLILAAMAVADATGAGGKSVSNPESWRRTIGFGAVIAHMIAIARVGGDFMGFRLLLPDLAVIVALCAGALGRMRGTVRIAAQTAALLAGGAALFLQGDPPHEREWIVNERLNFASAFTKPSDAFTGRPRHLWWNEGRLIRSFQECVGEPSVIVEYPNIGYYGVAAGTRVSVIDGNGLVDRFVARNWAARKGVPRGRPGHEGKMTLDYAVRRNIQFVRDSFDPYGPVMKTDYGYLVSLDPRILCTLPGKADALRELKARLLAAPTAKSLDTLQFLDQLERRDGVKIENVCRVGEFADCSPAGIQRAARGEAGPR